jgi:hypothetical protein
MNENNIMRINVGGRAFVLSPEITDLFEFFDGIKMCGSGFSPGPGSNDEIPFIDADPVIFKYMIDRIEKQIQCCEKIKYDESYSQILDYLGLKISNNANVHENDELVTNKIFCPNDYLMSTNNERELVQLVATSCYLNENKNENDRESLYTDFVRRIPVHEVNVFRFKNYEINIKDEIGTINIYHEFDVFDLIYLGFEFDHDIVLDPDQLIDWVKIKIGSLCVYQCTGYYLGYWLSDSNSNTDQSTKGNSRPRGSNVHYLKIPFVHSKKHFYPHIRMSMPGQDLSMEIKFKNTKFKTACGTFRAFQLESPKRDDIAWNNFDLLIHNPIEGIARNKIYDNNIIFNIDTRYAIRDFEFKIRGPGSLGMKSATLLIDNKIRWKYDALMLRKIIPQEVLGRELEPDHY